MIMTHYLCLLSQPALTNVLIFTARRHVIPIYKRGSLYFNSIPFLFFRIIQCKTILTVRILSNKINKLAVSVLYIPLPNCKRILYHYFIPNVSTNAYLSRSTSIRFKCGSSLANTYLRTRSKRCISWSTAIGNLHLQKRHALFLRYS